MIDPPGWEFAINVPGQSLAKPEPTLPLTIVITPAPNQSINPDEPYHWPLYGTTSGWNSDSSDWDSSSAGCEVTGITPDSAIVGVGCDQVFTAEGNDLDDVTWSTSPAGDPATGHGATFTTNWDQTGSKTVTASCSGNSVQSAVTVVAVDQVIVEGSDPESSGPVEVPLGLSVELRAKRTPAPADGPWPNGRPQWVITDKPSDFAAGLLFPSVGGKIRIVPGEIGTWKVKAKCCDSEDEIVIEAIQGCGWITNVTADKCFERVLGAGQAGLATPMQVLGLKSSTPDDVVTLTITLKSGGDSSQVTWVGATQDSGNPLKATVPIDQSVLKKVTVQYDGKDCREIFVWPLWAEVTIRTTGKLSPDNQAVFLGDDHEWPENYGGGNDLGPTDVWQNPNVTYADVLSKIEAVAKLTPLGVGAVTPAGSLAFRRSVSAIGWVNTGHYEENNWEAGPESSFTNMNDTSNANVLDLSPSGNDQLFDLDAPGQDYDVINHTAEMYSNFTQYVTFVACGEEVLCSNEAAWSYRSRVDYDKPQDQVELNEAKESHITLPDQPHYSRR